MSRVTYFQRYSSKENVVTNTVLHLFSQINAHSTDRLRELLVDLFDDDAVPLGVQIHQQVRSSASIPDGFISQEPVHIIIETKVDAAVDADQLTRHLQAFKHGTAGNYLLLLTVTPAGDADVSSVSKAAQAVGVTFKAFTFERVCESLKDSVQPYEIHLKAIVEDFLLYCNDMGLLPDRREWMRIVPCGETLDLNARWGVYYHPTDRGYSDHEFVGAYAQKAVRFVGKLKCIFDYVATAPPTYGTIVSGAYDSDCLRRIEGIVADTKKKPGWDVSSGYRFFCVDKFIPTLFVKKTAGGIQGARFYDVSQIVKDDASAEGLAQALRDQQWE